MKSQKCSSSHKDWASMCLCPKVKLKSTMITILPSGQHLSVKMEHFHCVPYSCSREHLQRTMRAVELVYTFAVIKTSQERCMQHLLIWPRVRSRSCRGHRAPCWSHKLRQRFPVLCMHQHMHTPLPSNVRQEDEFHLDRGTWWGLALAWLCVCDSAHWLQSDVV